jgi:hypothetical protein
LHWHNETHPETYPVANDRHQGWALLHAAAVVPNSSLLTHLLVLSEILPQTAKDWRYFLALSISSLPPEGFPERMRNSPSLWNFTAFF